ncbi:MAG: hypothetical protein ACJAZ0_001298 [Halioglobus sp.]|jgi:hypothetical protein
MTINAAMIAAVVIYCRFLLRVEMTKIFLSY